VRERLVWLALPPAFPQPVGQETLERLGEGRVAVGEAAVDDVDVHAIEAQRDRGPVEREAVLCDARKHLEPGRPAASRERHQHRRLSATAGGEGLDAGGEHVQRMAALAVHGQQPLKLHDQRLEVLLARRTNRKELRGDEVRQCALWQRPQLGESRPHIRAHLYAEVYEKHAHGGEAEAGEHLGHRQLLWHSGRRV